MVNLLDFFQAIKNSYEKIKASITTSKDELLANYYSDTINKLPSELLDNYYYDELDKTWKPRNVLPIQRPLYSTEQRLEVNAADTFKSFTRIVKASDPKGHYDEYVELPFMADSITIMLFDQEGTAPPTAMDLLFALVYLIERRTDEFGDDISVVAPLYELHPDLTGSPITIQIDCKPYNSFIIHVDKYPTALNETISYQVIFHKQKKTKISDLIFSALWEDIIDVGASKDSLFDKFTLIDDDLETLFNSSLGLTLFLHQNASSDIAGYRQLLTDFPDDAKTEVFNATITSDDQEIEQWSTEPNQPALLFLLHGIYGLHIHAYKVSGTKDVQLYFKIYKRDSGGTETLLGTSHEGVILPGVETDIDLKVELHEGALDITDRIVLKIFAVLTGLGSNPLIYAYVEGDTLTRFVLPVSTNITHDSLTGIDANNHHTKTTSLDHTALTNVLTSQHHVKAVSGDISLASLAEKLHASLSGVSANQHHAESHDHDSDTLQLDGINSDGGDFDLLTSGALAFKVSGVIADFLELKTSSGIPIVDIRGGNSMRIQATEGAANVIVYLYENGSNYFLLRWGGSINAAVMASTHVMHMRPNGDNVNFHLWSNTKYYPSATGIDIGANSATTWDVIYYHTLSDKTCACFVGYTALTLHNMLKAIQPRTDGLLHHDKNSKETSYFPHIDMATIPDEFAVIADEDYSLKNVPRDVLGVKEKTGKIDFKKGDKCGINFNTMVYAMNELLVQCYEKINILELRISELEAK